MDRGEIGECLIRPLAARVVTCRVKIWGMVALVFSHAEIINTFSFKIKFFLVRNLYKLSLFKSTVNYKKIKYAIIK